MKLALAKASKEALTKGTQAQQQPAAKGRRQCKQRTCENQASDHLPAPELSVACFAVMRDEAELWGSAWVGVVGAMQTA